MVRRPLKSAVPALLVATAAWAAWQSAPIGSAAPNDVNLVDAGVAVLGHSQGLVAVYWSYGAPTMTLGQSVNDAGSMQGGRLGPGGCVYGARTAQYQLLGSTPTCGVVEGAGIGTSSFAFRTCASGGAFVGYNSPPLAQTMYHQDGGLLGGWVGSTSAPQSSAARYGLGVATVAGTEDWMALIASPQGAVYVARPAISLRAMGNVGRTIEVAGFEHASRFAVLVGVQDGGVVFSYDAPDAAVPTASVPVPPPGEAATIAITEIGGDGYGAGFGLIGNDAGLWGAVPNPAAPGQVWVPRTEIAIPQIVRATCLDSANCIVLGGLVGSGKEVNWYYNVNAPVLADGGTLRIAADAGSTFQATLPIVDLDGDPYWVTWDTDAGTLSVAPVGPPVATFNQTAVFGTPTSVACGTTAFPFTFRASDGWAPHTALITGFIDVNRSDPPGVPVLGNGAVTLYSGLGSQFVSVTASTSGCPGSLAAPIFASGAGFTATAVDGGYLLSPDLTFCGLDGGGAVTATIGNDAGSASAALQVSVVPWGAPSIGSFSPGPTFDLDAGSSQDFGLGAAHVCLGASGFPGLDVVYSLDGGGPTVTVGRSPDGGFTVTSTDACVAAQLEITARTLVRGEDAGRVSAGSASLAVAVVPNYPPVTPDQFDAGFAYDAPTATVHGELSLSAQCAAQRGLDARVAVYGNAGTVVQGPARFAIPGPWAFSGFGGCNGGSFFARAELMNGAAPTGIEQLYAFSTTYRPAAVVGISPAQVQVRCGQPTTFTVAADPGPNACLDQEYLWAQTGGPPVRLSSQGGAQIALTTDAEFDALGGAAIELEVSSDAGFGNVGKPVRQAIVLVPAPFVALSHSFEPLPGREGEALPIRATLENTSGCDVTGLVLREDLGRLGYVAHSARVNGAAADADTSDPAAVLVGPIDLPAHRKAVVTWLARAPLSSVPRVTGSVTMRGSPVTLDPPVGPVPGCGCGSAPALGWWVLAALARLLLRRRR